LNIDKELQKGHFVIGKCTKCGKKVWPPMDFCDECFGEVIMEDGPQTGRITEFAKKENEYFCIIEMTEEIRIMGKLLSGTPKNNQLVKITQCGIVENNYFFEFSLLESANM